MYARGYRMKAMRDMAVKSFAKLPAEFQRKLSDSDYSEAERRCPQRMPIAQLMREACLELNVAQSR